ncbi:MAG TPA: IS66 family insertion sequence element accessory protein TnpB [Roseateles sp.]
MFFPEARVRVYLYGQPVDMRRSYDGLYALARGGFAGDPTGGDLYVFINRRGTQMKVLYFDRSGWCVWAKRLEAGVFISAWQQVQTQEIDCTRLKLLLEGIEPKRFMKRYRHQERTGPRRGASSAAAVHPHQCGGSSMNVCVA